MEVVEDDDEEEEEVEASEMVRLRDSIEDEGETELVIDPLASWRERLLIERPRVEDGSSIEF